MKGFLNFCYNGHPCFVRDEYESTHIGDDELQRLEDTLDLSFSDVNSALYYCLANARYLLYRLESNDIDNELLRGQDHWVADHNGYVHIVTGEFVYGLKPHRDSWPCWKKEEPLGSYSESSSMTKASGLIATITSVFDFLATVMGGK